MNGFESLSGEHQDILARFFDALILNVQNIIQREERTTAKPDVHIFLKYFHEHLLDVHNKKPPYNDESIYKLYQGAMVLTSKVINNNAENAIIGFWEEFVYDSL